MATRAQFDRLVQTLDRIDAANVAWMQRHGVTLLRLALAIVFLWFGALKVLGVSPVEDLVAATVYWVSPEWFVPFLGLWEMAIGLGLLFAVALRATLLLLALQLAGTFLVLVVRPDVAFVEGNPFLLTVEGEFVVKNLVLLAAGVVIGGTVRGRQRTPDEGESDHLDP